MSFVNVGKRLVGVREGGFIFKAGVDGSGFANGEVTGFQDLGGSFNTFNAADRLSLSMDRTGGDGEPNLQAHDCDISLRCFWVEDANHTNTAKEERVLPIAIKKGGTSGLNFYRTEMVLGNIDDDILVQWTIKFYEK